MTFSKRSSSPLTVTQLLCGMALFGSSTPLSKLVGNHFSVFTASFARMAIAATVLTPFVLFFTDRFADAKKSDWVVVCAISAFGMVGFTATMLFGMRLTSGVIGSTIMSATPAVTAAAAVVFFGSTMNWRKGTALALALLGIAIINLLRDETRGSGSAPFLGAALICLAVCLEAAYTLLSRKLGDGMSSLEATLAASLMALPLFAGLAVAFDPAPFALDASREAWLALVFWGAAAGGLAPYLWYSGVRKAPGILTAGAMAVMPISALTLSYVLLGESFHWSHLLGFGAVFAGLILMVVEHSQKQQSAETEP